MQGGFYILGSGLLACLVIIVWSGHFMHTVFAFMALSVVLAGWYLHMGGAFVGVTQLMVYVGGGLVLLAYGMMLSIPQELQQPNRYWVYASAAGLCTGLIFSLTYAWRALPSASLVGGQQSEATTLTQLGLLMVSRHGVLMEIVGLILLVTLVGVVRMLAPFLRKKDA